MKGGEDEDWIWCTWLDLGRGIGMTGMTTPIYPQLLPRYKTSAVVDKARQVKYWMSLLSYWLKAVLGTCENLSSR